MEGGYGEGKTHLLRLSVAMVKEEGGRAAYVTCEAGWGYGKVGNLLLRVFKECGMELGSGTWLEAEAWFKLSHVARERFPERFSPTERSFLYRMGVYTARGWMPSEKQRAWARQLMAEVLACGASEELAEVVWSLAREKGIRWVLAAVDEAEQVAEGGVRKVRAFVGLLEQVAAGRIPVRMVVAVTPEFRTAVEEHGLRGRNGVVVEKMPPLKIEEAAELAGIVMDVFERAGGRAEGVTTAVVRRLLERYPTRRAFVQGLVRWLECGSEPAPGSP